MIRTPLPIRLGWKRVIRAVFLLLAVTVLGVRSSEATPVTWLYTGTVVSSFDPTLVSVGSPVTTLLTVDPAANFIAGNPAYLPSAGGYYFTAVIDFAGLQYVLSGAFEVNQDLVFGEYLPGQILFRYLSLGGPP